jgi:hypothetical protein
MGRGDNRHTPKSRRRARQRKLKARKKRRMNPDAAKAAAAS